jgi:hypothetical protein
MTKALTANKHLRLRALEERIKESAGNIQKSGLQIGEWLIEIRDDELWADDHNSWGEYLKAIGEELVGKSFAQSTKLIQAAEIHRKLPDNSFIDETIIDGLSATHMNELGRLAPTSKKAAGAGVAKDYTKLRKGDIKRVLKKAVEISDSQTPSVRDIRKAVDADLGIDRAAKAKATQKKNNEGVDVAGYLLGKAGQIEVITERLAEIPADAWKLLEGSHPGLAERLATACDELAELLRS